MKRVMWKEFRKHLRRIHNLYGLTMKEGMLEPAEIVYAACEFCNLSEISKKTFITSDEIEEQYKLLTDSIEWVLKHERNGVVQRYDSATLKRIFSYNFQHINEIIRSFRADILIDGMDSLKGYDDMVSDMGVPEYTSIMAIIRWSVYELYGENPDKVCSLLSYYDKCSRIANIEVDDKINMRNIVYKKNEFKKQLKEKIKGQDMAVDKFVDGYLRHMLQGKTKGKPAALYLFAGPPGTGKTYMAETFTELLKSEGYVYRRFDMSAYGSNNSDSITGLVGFEKTFRGSQPGQLTDFVRSNPKCVLLFDEIEKASPNARMLFLSILEGATLRDKFYDESVSFEDAILIFTTNEGKDLYEDNRGTNLTSLSDSVVLEGLRASEFAPELISRFMSGTVIVFNHLNSLNLMEIFNSTVKSTIDNICKNSVDFEFSYDENMAGLYLLNKGVNRDARFVSSNTKKMVEDYFFKIMEVLRNQGYRDLSALNKISVSVELNDTVKEYFGNTQKLRILGHGGNRENSDVVYLGDVYNISDDTSLEDIKPGNLKQLFDYESPSVELFGEMLRECNWNSTNKEDKYDAILIDLFSNCEKDKKIRYTDTEGYKYLKLVSEERLEIPVIVVDKEFIYWSYDNNDKCWKYVSWDMSFTSEERAALRKLGVTHFVKGVSHIIEQGDTEIPTEEYFQCDLLLDNIQFKDIMDGNKFAENAEILAKKSQKISADTIYEFVENELKIIFSNLRIVIDIMDDSEMRQMNKKYLLQNKPPVRVRDIFGNELAKEAVKRCIDNIRYPDKYKAAGAKLMKGILMYGAPGMGKTMFAKAMAYESGAEFISTVGSDFIAEGGIDKLEQIFKTARRKKPCVIFIDEFDAIAENREAGVSGYVKILLEKFLKEMDGLETNNDGVYVVGATNYYPEDLDSAVMRRFSAKIKFDYPNMNERQQFILHALKNKGLGNVLTERTAKTLSYMTYENMRSYAEMESFIEESISEAVYMDVDVTAKFLFNRAHNVNDGVARKEENIEKLVSTAYHEAGHAVLQRYFGRKNEYVTIVSRGNYGGYAMADSKLYTEQDFLNQICISFAGRVAEMMCQRDFSESKIKNGINIGANADLQTASQMAYEYVCRYGFGENLLVVPKRFARQNGGYPEDVLSERDKEIIWERVRQVLNKQWEITRELLQEEWNSLNVLAISLVIMKELDGEKVETIISSGEPYVEESCFINENRDYINIRIGEADEGFNYVYGYSIYPTTDVRLTMDDSYSIEVSDKKYYYAVKTVKENFGIYEDILTAYTVAYYNRASCRRFESMEAAMEYMDLVEIIATNDDGNCQIDLKVDAMDDWLESNAIVKKIIGFDEKSLNDMRGEAALNGLNFPQFFIGYVVDKILSGNKSACVLIKISDDEFRQEFVQYMDNQNEEASEKETEA